MGPTPGWTRQHWADAADGMLRAVRPFASPGHARVSLPGRPGGYGTDVDALEGFARTFLLAAFRIAGERGADPDNLAEWYAAGIAAGTDPSSPERWMRLDEHPQAKVEAASLSLALDMTREWVWDRLPPAVQERTVEYLAPAVGDQTYPRINWVWFRLVTQTFLRSVGGPFSLDDMRADLATHDSFTRADGWLADGDERAFDHYSGWALHLYPTLWARMAGAADLAAPRRDSDVALLDRFLTDAVALVGADGSPLLQGRSLTYRFAAAAPFWVGALAGVPSTPAGMLRRAASLVVSHFLENGALDSHGLLTIGWHGPWRPLAQAYSGPGSPYWAVKGMLGLALPAEHPLWTVEEQRLPVERADVVRVVRAPGWLVSGTVSDGIVRVVNHGTDHAHAGAPRGDSPLYARLGYSTATCPPLDDASWADPTDQAVTPLSADGRAAHRSGMRTGPLRVLETAAGPVAAGASAGMTYWLDADPEQQHHGSGWTGRYRAAAVVTVVSYLRGPWELRLSMVDTAVPLRISGWPAGPGDTTTRLAPVLGEPVADGTDVREDASPLGRQVAVPWLRYDAAPGEWIGVLLELTRATSSTQDTQNRCAPSVQIGPDGSRTTATIRWPDGALTDVPVLAPSYP
jgi:hypothetical protein